MRKVFTPFKISGEFDLSVNDSHHILVVLRHKVGDTVEVTDFDGYTYACTISAITGSIATLIPTHIVNSSVHEGAPVVLAAGVLKSDKFEWLVQKATELGVSRIVPVLMANCVVKLDEKRRRDKKERWQRIAQEAAKQCGRNDIPNVMEPVILGDLPRLFADYSFLVPYELETVPLNTIGRTLCGDKLVICIGPEGGFDKTEIQLLQNHVKSMTTVSLGKNILRAETAAIATLSIVMYERGFSL